MRRCAFLTLDDYADYVIVDDDLTYAPLQELGWQVEAVPWRRPGVAWDRYEAVVIRSTWDYIKDPSAFLGVLDDIIRAGTPLLNSLGLVRWNIRKTYLRDLASRGVPVAPTIWRDRLCPGELAEIWNELGTAEIVLKPDIGANSSGAYRLDEHGARTRAAEVEAHYANRALMAQPFLRTVTLEGEFSLFYFNGVHSHTILKTPKAADFRVQEEHGGYVRAVQASDLLLAAGDTTLRALPEVPLYARADFVRANEGDGFVLMELELIEPSLYFRMDAEAPRRFAHAFYQYMAERRGDVHG